MNSLSVEELNLMSPDELMDLSVKINNSEDVDNIDIPELDENFKDLNYERWADAVDEWFVDNATDYYKDGFRGFNERTPFEIYLDLRLSGKVIKFNETLKI